MEFLELLVLDDFEVSDIDPTSSESALVNTILGLVVVTGKLGKESDLIRKNEQMFVNCEMKK